MITLLSATLFAVNLFYEDFFSAAKSFSLRSKDFVYRVLQHKTPTPSGCQSFSFIFLFFFTFFCFFSISLYFFPIFHSTFGFFFSIFPFSSKLFFSLFIVLICTSPNLTNCYIFLAKRKPTLFLFLFPCFIFSFFLFIFFKKFYLVSKMYFFTAQSAQKNGDNGVIEGKNY